MAQRAVCESERVVGCCFRVGFHCWNVAAAITQVRDHVPAAVLFDVDLPQAVRMIALESDECSLSSRLVRSSDQTIRLGDSVDAPMADLDPLSFQIGFYGFTAPIFKPPNLHDPGHGFLR